MYNSLELREIFHLEFLRWLGRKIKQNCYAVKGGTNLRFFFKSFRYSEDMDIDIAGVEVPMLKEIVMKILQAPSFRDTLRSFGIDRIVLPDMVKAKQTQTTQRFKVHLIISTGEDLFTKVEFSRRGFKDNIIVESVLDTVLRAYKIAPLLVAHYDIQSAVMQKITALALRSVIQARDIFDLYILSSQYSSKDALEINNSLLTKAYDNLFEVTFGQFRDTVVFYLSAEDQAVYNSPSSWDEIKLKTARFIDELRG